MALKSIQQVTRETLQYIKDRHDGKIRSINLGYPKLNSLLLDGLELHTTLTIGARPSIGKTAVSDCIIDHAINLNKNLVVLDFNWEMSAQILMVRKLSARLKMSYSEILSAGHKLTEKELKDIEKQAYDLASSSITYSEEPATVDEFIKTVELFVERNPGKNILCRIDHTLLTKMSSKDVNQIQMLHNLYGAINILKKKHPIAFIVLTQLNREIEDRQNDAKNEAYPRQGDIYGGDGAAMFSETIILLNRPSKYGITSYGKTKIQVSSDDLFFHIVKNRNNTPDGVLRYKEDFARMGLFEM